MNTGLLKLTGSLIAIFSILFTSNAQTVYEPNVMVSTFAGTGYGSIDGAARIGENVPYISDPLSMIMDKAGTIYVGNFNQIVKINQLTEVSTWVGGSSTGSSNGTGSSASFNYIGGLVFDASGNLYVADRLNHKIRKVTPQGVVSTFAGTGTSGLTNATGLQAKFNGPNDIAIDSKGNLYVADINNHVIRKITSTGVVSTFAGTGVAGSLDGAGNVASFNAPSDIAIGDSDYVYVNDTGNDKIRKISPSGNVITYAGDGIDGFDDGSVLTASFRALSAIGLDSLGNVYVGDEQKIRKISKDGQVTTIVTPSKVISDNGNCILQQIGSVADLIVAKNGNMFACSANSMVIFKVSPTGEIIPYVGGGNSTSTASGSGVAAGFEMIKKMVFNKDGNLIVGQSSSSVKVRVVNSQGYVSTIAGNYMKNMVNGNGCNASFSALNGLCVDSANNIYVGDGNSMVIRKIDKNGEVTTFAGINGTNGNVNGVATSATFASISGIAIDKLGNFYVTDKNYIRKISNNGIVSNYAGTGLSGKANGDLLSASFNYPRGLAVDDNGNIYVADESNQLIRKISSTGLVTTLAGSGVKGSADGQGTAASFQLPSDVAVDKNGNVYVADQNNHKIRKITPSGLVTTVAGTGSPNYNISTGGPAYQDGQGNLAEFKFPYSIAIDKDGNLFVADLNNYKIRKITFTGGVTSTENTLQDEQIHISPNPVQNLLHISTSFNSDSRYEILTIAGKLVQNGIVDNKTISVESLVKGFYLLKIYSENKVFVEKFVKE